MAEPNTGGRLVTSLQDMQVGDYIVCFASFTGTIYTDDSLFYLGQSDRIATSTEFPVTGQASESGMKFFYFIKVDKGLLVSDRVIHHTVSWDTLNGQEVIQGKRITFQGSYSQGGILRSLTGGNAYADANGKPVTTDQGLGASPVHNEWDTYIVKKDYGTGAARDDVWHWSNLNTWCQETVTEGFRGNTGINNQRIFRGKATANGVNNDLSNGSGTYVGFRPVFCYEEASN